MGEKCKGSKKIGLWLDLDNDKNIQEVTEMYVIFTQIIIRKAD